jgi:hypothetical protein
MPLKRVVDRSVKMEKGVWGEVDVCWMKNAAKRMCRDRRRMETVLE